MQAWSWTAQICKPKRALVQSHVMPVKSELKGPADQFVDFPFWFRF